MSDGYGPTVDEVVRGGEMVSEEVVEAGVDGGYFNNYVQEWVFGGKCYTLDCWGDDFSGHRCYYTIEEVEEVAP